MGSVRISELAQRVEGAFWVSLAVELIVIGPVGTTVGVG